MDLNSILLKMGKDLITKEIYNKTKLIYIVQQVAHDRDIQSYTDGMVISDYTNYTDNKGE